MSKAVKPVFRMFVSGDERAILEMWNAAYTHDPITASAFARQTIGDPNFSSHGCWLAEVAGEPAGFIVAVAPGAPHIFAPPPGVGRITGLGVIAAHRRSGIGSQLLDRAIEFIKSRGLSRVVVAAPEYYVAGVDADAYPVGRTFLEARGFSWDAEAVAMGRPLYELVWPKEVLAAESSLAADGVEVGFLKDPEEVPAVEAFFAGGELSAWVEFFRRKMAAGDDSDDIVVARKGGTVIGYCQRLEADHVGPFGVSSDWRDRGLGGVMLYRLLDRMRQKGYRFAWFGETGRAQPFYSRAGFTVTRRYIRFAKHLEGGE